MADSEHLQNINNNTARLPESLEKIAYRQAETQKAISNALTRIEILLVAILGFAVWRWWP